MVEGIAALGAGGCDYRGDIIVNRNRLIGLGDSGFFRPAAVQIIGISSGSSPLIQQEKTYCIRGNIENQIICIASAATTSGSSRRFRAIGCVYALCIQSRRAT